MGAFNFRQGVLAIQHVMALVADVPGALRRIMGLYGSRNYKVRTLTVGSSGQEGVLRVSLVVDEPAERAQRFARQLQRLIDVISVDVAAEPGAVARELALIKVAVASVRRQEVLQLAEVFRARVIDAAPSSVVLEVTGSTQKIDAFLEVLEEYGITELARTGIVSLRRGAASLPQPKAVGMPESNQLNRVK